MSLSRRLVDPTAPPPSLRVPRGVTLRLQLPRTCSNSGWLPEKTVPALLLPTPTCYSSNFHVTGSAHPFLLALPPASGWAHLRDGGIRWHRACGLFWSSWPFGGTICLPAPGRAGLAGLDQPPCPDWRVLAEPRICQAKCQDGRVWGLGEDSAHGAVRLSGRRWLGRSLACQRPPDFWWILRCQFGGR